MSDTSFLKVGADEAIEVVAPDPVLVTVKNLGPNTVYYAVAPTVSALVNDGSLTMGQSIQFGASKWFVSALRSRIVVEVPDRLSWVEEQVSTLEGTGDASVSEKGVVRLATSPDVAGDPVAVGDNDPRLAGGEDASTTTKGVSKLSVAPASASDPIAVGDNDPRMDDSREPTGAAGGVLGGTYPDPTFAADMATQAELDAHAADTTSVHGITDTADLLSRTLVDAKGDLLAGTADNAVSRLGVGTTGHVLTADAAEATGVKWAAAPGASGGIAASIFDAKGDLIAASAADTAARLPAGTDGQFLSADSGEATGLAWVDSPSTDLATHEAETTTVHGIADTSDLLVSGDLDEVRTQIAFSATKTSSYEITEADAGTVIVFGHSGALTLDCPQESDESIAVEKAGVVRNIGSADVTIQAGTGATIFPTGPHTLEPGREASWHKVGTNSFFIGGGIS